MQKGSKNEIKGIVFDLGGVLVDDFGEEFLEYVAEKLKVSTVSLGEVIKNEEARMQQGEEISLAFWHRICKKLGVACPSNKIVNSLWVKPYKDNVRIKKDTLALARKIKCPKVIFSNTIKEHTAINKKRKLFEYFDVVLLSNEVGFRKPQKEFYQLVSKRLNIPLKNLLFIDNEERWIESAKKQGGQVLLFKSARQLEMDLSKLNIL